MPLRLFLRRHGAAACPLLAAAALALAPGPPPPSAAPTVRPGATPTPAAAGGPPGQTAAPPSHPRERGFPLIQSVLPPLAEAETQNFDVAADPRGYLYVANLGGLLVYDGAWWQLVAIGSQKGAFAVACDAAGRIAVGGIDDLGYLDASAGGALRFVSLLPLLPAAARQLGQVLQTVPAPGGFLFNTPERLLYWDGKSLSTLATFPHVRPFQEVFTVGGAVYFWSRDAGLARLAGRGFVPVPGGEQFRGRRIDALAAADGGLLASVRGEGLFRIAAGQVAPFAPEASRWAAANRLLSGRRLADGRWAFASLLGGLLLLLPDGRVEQVIDTAAGLANETVYALALDRDGALWLALDNGLARVEVASPISVVDTRSGLKGDCRVAARYRGCLWVGTASGLFTTAAAPPAAGAGDWDRPLRLRQVPGQPPAVWSLLAADEDLLVGEAFGIHVLRDGGTPLPLPGTPQSTVFVLARSRSQPDRVWVGLENGLAALRRDRALPAGWRFEGMIDSAVRDVRAIVEGAGGTVWCSSDIAGVVGYDVPAASLRPARVRHVPASGEAHLLQAAGGILAVRDGRVQRLDEAGARLVAETAPAPAPASRSGPPQSPPLPPSPPHVQAPAVSLLDFPAGLGSFAMLAEDAAGNIWMNTRPPSVAIRCGRGWAPAVRSLVEVPVRATDQFLAEPDGVVWLVTEAGLFRHAGPLAGAAPPLQAPHLSRITVGGGTVLFGGAPGSSPATLAAPELPPDVRRLRIELAPLSFRAGLRYQTRLEPIDAAWGNPSAEPFAELTQLPPGRYTFHARTVGPGGEVSPQTAWSFRVRPPWYLASWALALALVGALGGVRGYTGLRNRALRQRAARLEARVAEQTVALRHNVEELRRAQGELEAANARLEALTLADELTGIANRRHLQQVLDAEWNRARRLTLPVAFIILDLDHFKLLNDTQGHREGDLCLQAVAAYLARALRRAGDLVARYGGEEFAVLLPATDLATALQYAEQLRLGIEALALPHAAAPYGHITASFGVAALVPAPGQSAGQLVEAADAALYRAKAEGRNRVWPPLSVAAPDGTGPSPAAST
ncbi:MAG TPA: diguanylate cyclase [Thermoanaerobaculia bacterium]|jgi:diguanylate cyclase (GGDEF)-like protein|nr:diguanylate cyclase [Thermoanaerobaculia bacterium]